MGMCIVSVLAVFVAKSADGLSFMEWAPEIPDGTIVNLLRIIASSMLMIATFAAGAMVSSYVSASQSASPRAFTLVIADDVSQIALSRFIGAFIYSIVALVAIMYEMFERAGRFTLFCLTLLVFAVVVLTFVRWVDRIARLGLLSTSVDKAEKATAGAMKKRCHSITMGAHPRTTSIENLPAVYSERPGYLQHVDMARLQEVAEDNNFRVIVTVQPGTFIWPGDALCHIDGKSRPDDEQLIAVRKSFHTGKQRTFDEDPQFGMIVLSEIAIRALSPAVNDPGTAIDIIGRMVRLFTAWQEHRTDASDREVRFENIEAPSLSVGDMMDDAFRLIGRDGADRLEVGIHLQKGLASLARSSDREIREAAIFQAGLALERAETALTHPADKQRLRAVALS